MGVIGAIGIGLSILTISLFVYVLVDCIRRNEADFPTLIYGGKSISQRVVKRTWTWILTLSFILGLFASQQIYSASETGRNITLPSGATAYSMSSPFHIYEVKKISDEEVYRKRALRVPLLFFLGAFLYYRGVKKWPRKQEQSS